MTVAPATLARSHTLSRPVSAGLAAIIADMETVHRHPFIITSDESSVSTTDPELAWHDFQYECARTDGPVAICRRGWVIHERRRL